MEQKVYLVIQTGVYRHDVVGVMSSLDAAKARAEAAAAMECDSYHDYEVYEVSVDEDGPPSNQADGEYVEPIRRIATFGTLHLPEKTRHTKRQWTNP